MEVTKSYPQVGLGVIFVLEYNVYQVGKSGIKAFL